MISNETYTGRKMCAMIIFLIIIFVLTGIIYYYNIPLLTALLAGLLGFSLSLYTGLIEKWMKDK
jgi:hypothetical protein